MTTLNQLQKRIAELVPEVKTTQECPECYTEFYLGCSLADVLRAIGKTDYGQCMILSMDGKLLISDYCTHEKCDDVPFIDIDLSADLDHQSPETITALNEILK